MTIFSMTGYASVTREAPDWSMSLEIRSVNNRYLDVQLRLPDEFRKHEPTMREALTKQLGRGKIECRLNHIPTLNADNEPQLDRVLLQKLLQLEQIVKTSHPAAPPLTVTDILKWPGMLGTDTTNGEADDAVLALLHTALEELKAARIREGEKLRFMLLERTERMRQLLQTAAPRIPALIAAFEEKLRIRLTEILGTQEQDRIHQEITLFVGKIDIDEELSRLRAHLDETERIIHQGGAVGKRLDFMMQELHREANTIGSKSVDLEITRIAMELKVIVEQMREQIQNIE
ncbi:MAG: YicC family protein [Nitrosomonas sp.]|nr:MAG: YicC family protein [Nitrosomonas sp.]